MVVKQLEMPARDEAGVSHVDIYFAAAGVAPDNDSLLADEVLEVPAVEARDGDAGRLLRPLHLRGRRRSRLEREQRPRVALGAGPRVRIVRLGHPGAARRPASPHYATTRGITNCLQLDPDFTPETPDSHTDLRLRT